MQREDITDLKIEFFQSPFNSLEEFFRHKGLEKIPRRENTIGRSKEKQEMKKKAVEEWKREETKRIKEKTGKFYQNMRNVMMSHAQSLVEYKEIIDQDGNKHKIPVFKDIKEVREAIKEVRTFNGDVNSYRDLGIRNNEDGGKIANVQFVFSDEEQTDLGEE